MIKYIETLMQWRCRVQEQNKGPCNIVIQHALCSVMGQDRDLEISIIYT